MSRTIECICLFALLAVVGLRPLIAETYDSAGLAMTSVLPGVEDPTPATTLIIDGVIMLAALGWLVARWCSDDRSYRWSGIEWGAIVIVVAAIVSCIFAGNKRLAVNGAVDWLCCVLLAIVLAQLLRERWQLQLALCVILASAGAQAVECFHQTFYSFSETEAMYEANRDAIWQNQGVALDSPEVELFEARMRSREASGYLTHSNVAGAYLVTCGLVALGLALSRWRGVGDSLSRLQALPALAVSAIILGAGVLTHSRGALSAGAAAIVLWILRVRFDGVIARHSKAAFRWAWLAVALGGMAVVGHGVWQGSLPGRSLDFRWKYWTASARMFADRPLAGVGSGNFGRHYLQYKTIESPEEVKNPHNFLVSAATDWGVGGLVGMVMMLVGASRVVARRRNRLDELPGAGASGSEGALRRGRFYGWGALIAAGIFLPRLKLLGNDDPNYLFFSTMLPLLAWATTFVFIGLAPVRRLSFVSTGMAFALFAFLLQDTINFASIVPATATTAFALLGILVAARYVDDPLPLTRSMPYPSAWVLAGGAAFVVYIFLAILPVQRCYAALREARRSDDPQRAYELFLQAADDDHWDPTPFFEATRTARFLATQGERDPLWTERALECVARNVSRDPFNIASYRQKMRTQRLLAELANGPARDAILTSTIRTGERIVELYPSDPQGHVALGDCLADYGRAKKDRVSLRRAIDSYERALELDDARPEWETIRRMRPAERTAISSKTSDLRIIGAHFFKGVPP